MILDSLLLLLLKLHKDNTVVLPVAFHSAGGDGIRTGSGFFTSNSSHLHGLRAHLGFHQTSDPEILH